MRSILRRCSMRWHRELEGAIHRISAASCYEKSGDPSRAVNLYRAALSGPLREDTREEVENMLNACLATLDHQPVGKRFYTHIDPLGLKKYGWARFYTHSEETPKQNPAGAKTIRRQKTPPIREIRVIRENPRFRQLTKYLFI